MRQHHGKADSRSTRQRREAAEGTLRSPEVTQERSSCVPAENPNFCLVVVAIGAVADGVAWAKLGLKAVPSVPQVLLVVRRVLAWLEVWMKACD